ncbi:hypothetical protein MSG28_000002 [Choristoneura fumiferana]|uniref:Uncharacterized protein n=1 Tax=Choristoneura fumiferana TaxID=7141 RepID=A0ACC0JZ23_CHOFU|nr:hypothetical protein MSG28_000002 [Choristoneura fumiferana]
MNAGNGSLECSSDAVSESDKLFRFVVHGVLLNVVGCGGLLGNALCVATVSVYLTLVVTAERWVAVCRPLRARALCTPRRARAAVAAVAAFSLAYNAPKFLEVKVTRYAVDGDEIYCVEASPFRTELYVVVYVHWLYLLVMYAVPFTLLAVLNAAIVRQGECCCRLPPAACRLLPAAGCPHSDLTTPCQFTNEREFDETATTLYPSPLPLHNPRFAERARLSRSQRRELSLATMLLVVVLVFFLCNLLPLVFLGSELERLDALVKTSNLLVTINSSANFLIYVLFGDKFKRVFLATFCRPVLARLPCGRRQEDPDDTRDDSCSAPERLSLRVSLARDATLRCSAPRDGTLRCSAPRRPRPRRADPGPGPPSANNYVELGWFSATDADVVGASASPYGGAQNSSTEHYSLEVRSIRLRTRFVRVGGGASWALAVGEQFFDAAGLHAALGDDLAFGARRAAPCCGVPRRSRGRAQRLCPAPSAVHLRGASPPPAACRQPPAPPTTEPSLRP